MGKTATKGKGGERKKRKIYKRQGGKFDGSEVLRIVDQKFVILS